MKKIIGLFTVLLLVLLIGFVLFRLIMTRTATTEAIYIELPIEVMMKEADSIFTGKVTQISETRWNQDNGRFWTEGLPYHTVTLSLISPIVGTHQEEVVITVIGDSPLDSEESGLSIESGQSLSVGDEIAVFARETEIVWREPATRPVTMFMSSPTLSTLLKGEDGLYHAANGEKYSLDEFVTQVQKNRGG